MSSKKGNENTVVVTGTGSGVGLAIAEALLAGGWKVVGLDIRKPVIQNPSFRGIQIDLTNSEDLQPVADSLVGVKALVHAAGFMRVGPLGELDPDDGLLMWKIHVGAATLLANVLAPHMGAGGRIVLIGSRVASGQGGKSQYAAAKAALIGLVKSWAIELALLGITANVVSPAATDTEMLNDPLRASVQPNVPPIGRFIRPNEIAAYVVFLLGRDAGAITGQNLLICGGSSL